MRIKKSKYPVWLDYVLIFLLGFAAASLVYYAPFIIKHVPFQAQESFQPVHKTIPILAVSLHKNQGLVGYANIDIRPGEGRILVETSPFVEPDTQYSANTAVKVAGNITKVPIDDKEIIFSFDTGSVVIGGPSAGAAMTLLAIAALSGKGIKEDIMVTGTVSPDGRIGQIGHVIEKVDAAGTNQTKVLLVPPSQRTLTFYDRRLVKKEIKGVVTYSPVYVSKHLDINQYTRETYNMSVKEVTDIEDVMRYMLG